MTRRGAGIVASLMLAAFVLAGVARPIVVLGATPSPSEPPAGDTRSSGEGAGFVGQPIVAVALVLGVGLVAAGATLVYVRLTSRRR